MKAFLTACSIILFVGGVIILAIAAFGGESNVVGIVLVVLGFIVYIMARSRSKEAPVVRIEKKDHRPDFFATLGSMASPATICTVNDLLVLEEGDDKDKGINSRFGRLVRKLDRHFARLPLNHRFAMLHDFAATFKQWCPGVITPLQYEIGMLALIEIAIAYVQEWPEAVSAFFLEHAKSGTHAHYAVAYHILESSLETQSERDNLFQDVKRRIKTGIEGLGDGLSISMIEAENKLAKLTGRTMQAKMS